MTPKSNGISWTCLFKNVIMGKTLRIHGVSKPEGVHVRNLWLFHRFWRANRTHGLSSFSFWLQRWGIRALHGAELDACGGSRRKSWAENPGFGNLGGHGVSHWGRNECRMYFLSQESGSEIRHQACCKGKRMGWKTINSNWTFILWFYRIYIIWLVFPAVIRNTEVHHPVTLQEGGTGLMALSLV